MAQRENYDEELEKAEEEQASSDDSNETPPADIVAFNELRSCADLFRLHSAHQLEIQPDYQRDVVWNGAEQTRFIDSLAKQLPIPSMCISLDYKTDKRQVVDGLQRMTSIIQFLSDPEWRLSSLDDIDSRISNKTVEYIKKTHPEIYSRIENTTIPVTVLRCDLKKRNHQEYLFTIFHRLNKGGLKLTNQEIRNCIYSGRFNKLLRELVKSEVLRNLFSIDENKKYRFSNEELILRIFAFSDDYKNYKGPLSKYLNAFMDQKRNAPKEQINQLKIQFINAANILYEDILDGEPLPRLSKVTTESIFVGIITNYNNLKDETKENLKSRYDTLRTDPLFSGDALKEGLAATEKVKARLSRAVEVFG